MPIPPIEHFAATAADLGISLTPGRLQQAHETHAGFRSDLERLRALPLPYLEPGYEPVDAFVWIANGGVS